jgi:hypothetical protein
MRERTITDWLGARLPGFAHAGSRSERSGRAHQIDDDRYHLMQYLAG